MRVLDRGPEQVAEPDVHVLEPGDADQLVHAPRLREPASTPAWTFTCS